MVSAWLLAGVLASQMPFGNQPEKPPAETGRTRGPTVPDSADQRKLQSLRARLDFARQTRNQASLAALDAELKTLLPEVPPAKDGGGMDLAALARVAPTDPAYHQALALQLRQVEADYSDAALAVRVRVLDALLVESHGGTPPPAAAAEERREPRRRR